MYIIARIFQFQIGNLRARIHRRLFNIQLDTRIQCTYAEFAILLKIWAQQWVNLNCNEIQTEHRFPNFAFFSGFFRSYFFLTVKIYSQYVGVIVETCFDEQWL